MLDECLHKIIIAGTVDRYDRLQVEYNGFCPVALLSGGEMVCYAFLSISHLFLFRGISASWK